MNSAVKKNIGSAVRLLLKPLVKLLIDQGITHQEFSDAAKEAFVEMALRHQVKGGKINRSRVAIVTGLTRKEVSAVMARAIKDAPQSRIYSRPERVLAGWYNDPDYTGPYGIPLEIPYEAPPDNESAPCFVNLVRVYSGDQSATQMLDELLRVGAIAETDPNHYKPLRRGFEPDRLSPKLIRRFGDVSYDLLTTLSANVQKERIGAGEFDRRVLADHKLSVEEIEQFETYLRDRGQQFLEEIDNWLALTVKPKDENDPEVFDTGVVMIRYATRKPEEKETLGELLTQLGLDEQKSKTTSE
ncbi:MAG: DUF6502 family protein [Woeseiaceae bacterium]|nr:DUF6502 family protein [Woeseiaceae bacterium]